VEVTSVCDGQQAADVPGALVMLDRALQTLATADAASLPTALQAQALRALERAEARHTAARARVLAAFTARDGHEDDGHASAQVWLTWQTQVTKNAAMAAVGWARRMADHPGIARALAGGELSVSWARAICGWTDRLPGGNRDDADAILTTAAAGGAELADLAGLAEEMYQRARMDRPDPDEDGFDDRRLLLDLTFGGAGRLTGDLAPGCAAALTAVLEALGKRAGPEDLRTTTQRRHDALEEACRRLIAGLSPGRRARHPGWLTGPEADAAACDATMVPVFTGHVDPAVLELLAEVFLAGHGLPAASPAQASTSGETGTSSEVHTTGETAAIAETRLTRAPLSHESRLRLRTALLALATDALSGPSGLAARLRAGLGGGPLATVSLPLDIGSGSETIPVHLRRAVIARYGHCALPGCDQPASVCDIHHLTPRAEGGPTALRNLVPLCSFHHKIVIHRWGWTLTLHPDGTTTATSPHGRTLHSHGPPRDGPRPPGNGPRPTRRRPRPIRPRSPRTLPRSWAVRPRRLSLGVGAGQGSTLPWVSPVRRPRISPGGRPRSGRAPRRQSPRRRRMPPARARTGGVRPGSAAPGRPRRPAATRGPPATRRS
jgi:hypothetical protein